MALLYADQMTRTIDRIFMRALKKASLDEPRDSSRSPVVGPSGQN
ncbi:MAG TPA: hypothetical protein VIH17_11025 [Candidatus Acidoferrales bacterium]